MKSVTILAFGLAVLVAVAVGYPHGANKVEEVALEQAQAEEEGNIRFLYFKVSLYSKFYNSS